jgi:hypothetical protein
LAKVQKQPAIASSVPAAFAIPTGGAEATVAALENYKKNLMETVDQQKAKLIEIRNDIQACERDLASAKDHARALVSTPATKSPAKKQAIVKPTPADRVEKPVAVQKAEQAGTATKGVRSRYKTKQQ